MLPKEFRLYYASDIEKLFGKSFTRDLLQAEPGKWTGPVWSSYGLHLVFVSDRIEGRDPQLAEVREEVERDWAAKRRREFKDETYRKLREGYTVIIDETVPSKGGDKISTRSN
jgi:parvulin-like peptidyl-prolyl isomerase